MIRRWSLIQCIMLTKFPQCSFELEFPETRSQYLICDHEQNVPSNSKIIWCWILFDMPFRFEQCVCETNSALLINSIRLPLQLGCHCVVWFQRSYSCQDDIDETEVIVNSTIMTVELKNPQHRTDFNFELRVTESKGVFIKASHWYVAITSFELSPFLTREEKSQSLVQSEIPKSGSFHPKLSLCLQQISSISHSTSATFRNQNCCTIFSNHRYSNMIIKLIKLQLLHTLIMFWCCMNDYNISCIQLLQRFPFSCHCIPLRKKN